MGNPFTSTSVSNFNSNPPSDDGSQTSANRVQWATHINKIGNPLKTAFDTSETSTNTAFGKIPGGAGITVVSTDYTVSAGDQGKLLKVTASGITITTPDATVVGAPFLFRVVNLSSGDITIAGNNPGVQQTVDGANTAIIPAGCGAFLDTDGTNWLSGGQNFLRTQITPQGYLTPTSGTPVITSDVLAATSIYYTPDEGDLVPIPDGSKFKIVQFAELTLALNGTNYVAGNLYDVYVAFDPADGSTVIVGTSPAWTTATAGSCSRGSGAGSAEITPLHGLQVNKNAMTLRNNATTYSVSAKCATLVGTIYIDSTNGQINCHVSYGQSRVWDIANAYNEKEIVLLGGDSTANWTYSTNTWRQSNNAAGNKVTLLQCLPRHRSLVTFKQNVNTTTGTNGFEIGVGWNSTSSPSGFVPQIGNGATQQAFASGIAEYNPVPFIGINVANMLENVPAGAGYVFQGTNAAMLMTARFRA